MTEPPSGPKRDQWASPPRSGGFELPAATPQTGDRQLHGSSLTLADFWSWAFSDLAANTTRSTLAEFLVARALGDRRPGREEWANFDVLTPDGIRVEVKSAGYLQRWRQWKPSLIRFGSFTGRSWDPHTGYFAEDRSIRAVSADTVARYGHRSANLAWVQRAAGSAVGYADLPAAVNVAHGKVSTS